VDRAQTAYVAEQWGRRWITIDTSRVALGTCTDPYYGRTLSFLLLKDSRDGQLKEAELTRKIAIEDQLTTIFDMDLFYSRIPHVMLSFDC